jgi:hypothetical protein
MIPREILKRTRQTELRTNLIVTKSAERVAARIPTGFRPPAQGCEARATLGHRPPSRSNRNAVAAPSCAFTARNVCHNPVGVDPHDSSFTQGSSCVATLGWGAQSLWDWTDSRLEPLNHNRNIQHSTFNAQYRRGSRCRLRSGLEVECRILNVVRVHGEGRLFKRLRK